MVRLAPILLAFAGILTLTSANDPTTQDPVIGCRPTSTESPLLASAELPGASARQTDFHDTTSHSTSVLEASLSSVDQDTLTETSPRSETFDQEVGVEVEAWSFCSEDWLSPLSWIGLCPDRYDFSKLSPTGTTRTVTMTRSPDRQPTDFGPSYKPSALNLIVRKTELFTSTSTEFATATSTRTTTTTETTTQTAIEVSTATSTITIDSFVTSTISVTVSAFAEAEGAVPLVITETETVTSAILVPTIISYTDTETRIADEMTTITVTSASTFTATITSMAEPTATVHVYEDGPAPNNTNCFGGAFLTKIQQEGCENFYALPWAERLLAWFWLVMVPFGLICFAIDLLRLLLLKILPKLRPSGEPTVYYQGPLADSDDSDDQDSKPDTQLENNMIPFAANKGEVESQPGSEDGRIAPQEADRAAEAVIEKVRRRIAHMQLCPPEDPDYGCWLLMVLNDQYDKFPEPDYCRAYEILEARYSSTEQTNADIRKEDTLPQMIPGAIQQMGPQDLNEIREKIRQWGDANFDAATATEIRTFVDKTMIPEHETDDPLFIINASQNLVGWSSGYGGIGPVPTWRVQLDVALQARTQEHGSGQPWSPQFEGNEDLWEEKAKNDARWEPEVKELKDAIKYVEASQDQAEESDGAERDHGHEGGKARNDVGGPDSSQGWNKHLDAVRAQLRKPRILEDDQQKKDNIPIQSVAEPTTPSDTALELTEAVSRRRVVSGTRIPSSSVLLEEIPISPEISPKTTEPAKLDVRAVLEAAAAAGTVSPAENTVSVQVAESSVASVPDDNNKESSTTPVEMKKAIPQKIKRRNPMFNKSGSSANSPTTGAGSGTGRRKSEQKDVLHRRQ